MLKNEKIGIAHIYATKNNTIITITDITGAETIAKCSGGMKTKNDRDEGSSYIAMKVAEEAINQAKEKGITALIVYVRGKGGHFTKTPAPQANSALRMLARSGVKILKIEDVTPIPTDTTRKPGGRRGRRA